MIAQENDSGKVYRKSPLPTPLVKPIGRVAKHIGKMIKGSKQEIEWTLTIDSQEHKIRLEMSKLSGKRRVYFDDKQVSKVVKGPNQKQLTIAFELTTGVKFEVREDGKVAELFINGASFSTLLNEGESELTQSTLSHRQGLHSNNFLQSCQSPFSSTLVSPGPIYLNRRPPSPPLTSLPRNTLSAAAHRRSKREVSATCC